MRTSDILLSGLSITEDGYNYKGQFILSCNNKSLDVDLSEFEDSRLIEEIKRQFDLEEPCPEIRRIIMEMVMDRALIASRHTEGENYN